MEYNKVAAKWWADKLRTPKPGNFNMGENNSVGGWAMLLGFMNSMDYVPTDESLNDFEQRLAKLIKERVESQGSMSLYCDYNPDYELGKLADECGIDSSVFPWKTSMNISSNNVSVSCGYGAPYEVIFSTK